MYSVRLLIDEGKLAADRSGGRIYISTESINRYVAEMGRLDGQESA